MTTEPKPLIPKETNTMEQTDDDVMPLDPTCPACAQPHGADEVFDGSERSCDNCGHTLVCVTYTDGSAYMQCYSPCPDCAWYTKAWRWLRFRLALLTLRMRADR
jgi:hypothetical protein